MKRQAADLERPAGFDLVVVGGSVTAAWIALDAARRGLAVAIVAPRDWGSGGATPGGGLIHVGTASPGAPRGGAPRRAAERRLLWKLGPHRFVPARLVVPLYGVPALTRWRRRVALWFAERDRARRRPGGRTRWLDRRRCRRAYRFLERGGLSGGFLVGECACEEDRLALELVAGAVGTGAVAVNHAPATRLLVEGGSTSGVAVRDDETGLDIEVIARAVVVCTRRGVAPPIEGVPTPAALSERRVAAAVLPGLHGDDGLVSHDAEGRPPLLILPWHGRSLVTSVIDDDTEDPLSDLLTRANRRLGRTRWARADVLSSDVALHAAPDGDPDGPAVVDAPAPFAWLVRGGGLTTARLDAAAALDSVTARLGRASPCRTGDVPLPWHPPADYRDWRGTVNARALDLGLDEATSDACRRRYGATIERLLELIETMPKLGRRFLPEYPFCYGELALSSMDEMARGLDDALLRRVPLARLERLRPDVLRHAADIVGAALGWDDARRSREIARLVTEPRA